MANSTDKQNWQLNESGILRKKDKDIPKEELLVFGYSCKLFRDDQRALLIDQGKHLIPWMGDENLKIDRYDGRGALYDLTLYEPPPGGQDQWLGLSNEERYVEQMCDEERYRALKTNEDEEMLYQEEELKRLQQALDSEKAYGQVAYNYSEEKGQEETEEKEADTEDDSPFIPPHELDIPVNMVVPEKTKLNAIIEKTAQFIHEQGAQMEVLLKMKQANNSQFEFLSFGSTLHPYYRHVLMAIKTGRYRPVTQKKEVEEKSEEDTDDHYLHPILATASSVELPEPAPVIPTINYKPSADCSYSLLVNKIKEKQCTLALPVINPIPPKEPVVTVSSPTVNNNPEVSIVRNDDESSNSSIPNVASPVPMVSKSTLRKRRKRARAEQALANAQYYMSEEIEEPVNEVSSAPPVEMPPPQLQLIIDKMASYVAKNGIDFEAIVKNKGDPRFLFLEETDQFNPYYRQKVDLYMQLHPSTLPEPSPSKTAVNCENSNSNSVYVEENSQDTIVTSKTGPVCFSIKKPKETEALESRSALPIEESTDEEDSDEQNSNSSGSKNKEENDKKHVEKTSTQTAENNAKWMEERLKDKLTATAKEKLLVKEREKQIQQERKKRAAAFLNLLQKERLVTSSSSFQGPNLPQNENNTISDDVESIPSPSSVIAISDSDNDSKSTHQNCNGPSVSHPVIDVSLTPKRDIIKRSSSPTVIHSSPKKKKRKHSKSTKRSHSKSKSSHRKHDERSSRHRKKYHSRSNSHKQSRKHKKHSSSKHKRVDKKKKRKSTSSSSSSDSESDSYSSSS